MKNKKALKLICFTLIVLIQHVYPHEIIQSLDGNAWTIEGVNPDRSQQLTFQGTVPGMVHPDLQREGLIPDPFWRDNFKKCQWPEHWSWTYKRTFDVSSDLLAKPWIQIQFDGIDTYSDIYLNGRKLASTNDMFLKYSFNIKDWLKEKGNVLEVRMQPLEKMVGEKARQKQFKGAFGDPYRAYVRRMQCTFGWDWVPRFITYGIWKPVRIAAYDNVRIDDIFIYTKKLNPAKANLSLELTVNSKIQENNKVEIKILDPKNKEVWHTEKKTEKDTLKFNIEIANPQIWWANGLGEQPLYTVEACIYNNNGVLLHQKSIETGIRTVAIEELKDSVGSSFTVILNGKRVYIKGANWVPADPFPARITKNKYATLLKQAHDAGLNMLRIWGGGIFEPQEFWDLCNRMGILTSQDFMLACGGYPDDDPGFVQLFKTEVEQNVKAIRNNPSIVFWCGDNELGNKSNFNGEWSCKLMHKNMTANLLSKIDPSRPFRPTSPFSYDPERNNSILSGDSHINSFLSDEFKKSDFDFANYRDVISKYSAGRFMSEQTAAGSPPIGVLKKFMNDDDLKGSEMYENHDIDNPGAAGYRTLFSHMEYLSEQLYGPSNGDINVRVRQMEYLQYEFVRLGLEGSRHRKFYSSGIQFWMYNDCWPALDWSLVDYWGGRKAGWYGFASGAKPVIATSEKTENDINWWVCNDLFKDVNVEIQISVQPVDGKPSWIKNLSLKIPANTSLKVTELPLAEMKSKLGNNSVLVCDVKYNGGNDRGFWTPARPMDVKYVPVELNVTQNRNLESGTITVSTEKLARVVTFVGDVDFEDNYFDLLPGETRTIKWKARSASFADEIKVSCWNEKPSSKQ